MMLQDILRASERLLALRVPIERIESFFQSLIGSPEDGRSALVQIFAYPISHSVRWP